MSGPGYLETAEIARRELRLFLSMAEENGMDVDGQRQWLLVSHGDWQSWLGILRGEPLPPRPALPLLLRRLGSLTSRMDRLPNAGRRATVPRDGTRRPCGTASAGTALPAG
jgi:hypothetical protein